MNSALFFAVENTVPQRQSQPLTPSVMKLRFLPLLITLFSLTACFQVRNTRQTSYESPPEVRGPNKIQIALLLDTSGSMDELLEQAKSEFWYLVDELMYTYQGSVAPELEIALYEYGNSRIGRDQDYIRLAVPLTRDLDWVASELWQLQPKGRKEYAGLVIDHAVQELQWSRNPRDIKMIFIAGNESFYRGPLNPVRAIERACAEGIEVHTLFAGTYEAGLQLGWEEAGNYCGSYSALDLSQPAHMYTTGYDAQICQLNVYYNQTFLPYGPYGQTYYDRCVLQDRYFQNYGNVWLVNRTVVKCGPFYTNPNWDLIDALDAGIIRLEDIPYNQLPPELRGLSRSQQLAVIARYRADRNRVRKEILDLNDNRRREITTRTASAPTQARVDQRVSLNETIANRVRTSAAPSGNGTTRRATDVNRTRTAPANGTTTRTPVRVENSRPEVAPRPSVNTDRQREEIEARRQAEQVQQRQVLEAQRQAEVNRQREVQEARRQAEQVQQRREAEARRQAEMDSQRREAEARRATEQSRQARPQPQPVQRPGSGQVIKR